MRFLVLGLWLVSSSCAPVEPGGVDAGATGALPECAVEPAPADYEYPAGPYGTQPGEVFEDFTLPDCERRDVRFRDVLAGAELVLFNVGAGWCQPCIDETERLEAAVHAPWCARGLRVVQVLFEDAESDPATSVFCRQWKESFGLTFPVLIDPLFTTRRYFEAAQTPLNLLVDSAGVIRYRETGTAAADLPQRIEALLPP